MSTKRITIRIPAEDKIWLDSYSQVHQISLAAAIRYAISQLKKGERRKTYQYLVESTSGLWRKGDGLAFQQATRHEWE